MKMAIVQKNATFLFSFHNNKGENQTISIENKNSFATNHSNFHIQYAYM